MSEALPLARHAYLDTTDPDEARARVSELFAPHRLDLPRGTAGFRALHHHARLATLSLYGIRYEPEVVIRSGAMGRFYLLLTPLAGACAVTYGDETVTVRPGACTMVNPFRPIALHWMDDCTQMVVKIDRGELERHVAAHVDAPTPPAVEFAPGTALPCAQVPGLRALLDLMFTDLDRDEPALATRAGEGPAEALFLNLLLRQYTNSAQELLARPATRTAPYYVKRVEEFIRLRAADPPAIEDMVRVAGVSARTLFKGFRDFRGIGPVGYLKQVRLDRVRSELLSPEPEETVTRAANRWGFHHLGNFAADYRARFGESPSATLRAARGGRSVGKDALPPQ